MRFSATTGCFYPNDIQYGSLPADLIEVPQDDFNAALAREPGDMLAVINGRVIVMQNPVPTAEQLVATLSAAVQAHLDAAARARGYDNIHSAVTYADEPAVASFQAEGQAFRAWRSLVWAACYAVLSEVQAGTRPVPTAEELIAELPALALPA